MTVVRLRGYLRDGFLSTVEVAACVAKAVHDRYTYIRDLGDDGSRDRRR